MPILSPHELLSHPSFQGEDTKELLSLANLKIGDKVLHLGSVEFDDDAMPIVEKEYTLYGVSENDDPLEVGRKTSLAYVFRFHKGFDDGEKRFLPQYVTSAFPLRSVAKVGDQELLRKVYEYRKCTLSP